MTATLATPDVAPPAVSPNRFSLGRAIKAKGLPLVILLIVVALVIPPVVVLIISSFASGTTLQESHATWNNFHNILWDKYTYSTLEDTAIFAVATAVVTVILATGMAWLVERTNTPGRRVVYGSLIIGLAVPTFIQGMGWLLFLGPGTGLVNTIVHGITGATWEFPIYTMGTMVFIQAMTLLPVIFLLIAPAMRAADPGLEEAAAMSGASQWKTILRVTLPLIRPALLAAVFLSFVITAESFEIPSLIGSPAHIDVLSLEVYARLSSGQADYGSATAFSILMMAFTLVGLLNYQRATKSSQRYTTIRGKAYRPTKLDLGRWRYLAAVPVVGIPLLVISPVLIMVWASFLVNYKVPSLSALHHLTFDSYSLVFHDPEMSTAIWHSLTLGVVAAVVVMLLTLVAGWLLVRRRSPLTRTIDFICTLPLMVPAIVLGLAVLRTFITLPIGLYGSQYIVMLALAIHYLPYGMRYSQAGIVSLHPELEEAAQTAGASQFTVLRRILIPLMWPTLIAGGGFIFLATIRQLSLVIFLSGPGYEVGTPVMFQRWQYGDICEAAAFAVVLVAIACIALAIFSKLTSRMSIRNPDAKKFTEAN